MPGTVITAFLAAGAAGSAAHALRLATDSAESATVTLSRDALKTAGRETDIFTTSIT